MDIEALLRKDVFNAAEEVVATLRQYDSGSLPSRLWCAIRRLKVTLDEHAQLQSKAAGKKAG